MVIQKYNPIWKDNFEKIKIEIQKSLSEIKIQIEHVGSTSVIGLAAKPIIDIDLIYYNDLDFPKIKSGLSEIGYFHNGNQGIPNREVFKRKEIIEKHPVLDKHKHHLYVCINESEELKRHLLFRDFLRENDSAKKKYEILKFQLAEEANQDRKKYAELKEIRAKQWIQSIINLAEKEFGKEM
ncbi:MAG: GrpB family protein [Saprospiraceae bacterium]